MPALRKRIKIFFVPTNVSGVVFYRAWQPYLALKRYEHRDFEPLIWWFNPRQYNLHPWESQIHTPEIGRTVIRDLDRGCAWADIVVWMGLHSYDSLNLFTKLKNIHGKPFITEVDDYLLSIPPKNAAHDFYKPGSELTIVAMEQIKRSDGMICSTPYLKDLYSPFNNNIKVVENVIDFTLWRKRKTPVRQGVTIGWVGGGTHQEDLEMIRDPMMRVIEKNKGVKFRILHGVPNSFKKLPGVTWSSGFKPTNYYPQWVIKNGFDIGVAPLVDNNFNRGKSNLRWLEYSAMGIPTVASPLPHFTQSIKHGATGFIANTPEQWEHYLTLLAQSRELRKDIGRNALSEVKNSWSLKSLGCKYKTVIKEFLNAEHDTAGSGNECGGVDRGPEPQPMDGSAEAGQDSGGARTVC